VTVLYCMKTHELPCIVSNGLYHVPPLPIPNLSPGFPNDACDQLGPPNSLVLTLPYPMVLLRMLTDDMPIQSLKFTTSFLSVCMKSTHTHTLSRKKKKKIINLNLFQSIIDNLMFSMSAFIWDGFSRKQHASTFAPGGDFVLFTPWQLLRHPR